MEQWNAINMLVSVMKNDKAIRAIFLKGSWARGDGDQDSDVDLYCLVHEEDLESFLEKRLYYLRHYQELLYWSEANFVAPQIVAVFSNGLHLDLYTVTLNTLQQTDMIKIIYDPDNLLADYQGSFFELNPDEVFRLFGSLTFSLLEFEAAYKRGNVIWASRLASHISGDLILLLRYVYNPKYAQLGFKKIDQHIPKELYRTLSNAFDRISPSKLPQGLVDLLVILEEIIHKLPAEIRERLNMKFYNFMADRIRSLN